MDADRAAFPGVVHQAGAAQHVEMAGESGGRQAEGLAQFAHRKPAVPGLHQGAEGRQPVRLGKRGKGGDGVGLIHFDDSGSNES